MSPFTYSYSAPVVREGQHILVQLQTVAGPGGMIPLSDGIALLPAALARVGGSLRVFDGPPPIEAIQGDPVLKQRAVNAELDAAELRVKLRRAEAVAEGARAANESLRAQVNRERSEAEKWRKDADDKHDRLALALELLKKKISSDNDHYQIIRLLESGEDLCPARLKNPYGAPYSCVRPRGHVDEFDNPSYHETVDGSLFAIEVRSEDDERDMD